MTPPRTPPRGSRSRTPRRRFARRRRFPRRSRGTPRWPPKPRRRRWAEKAQLCLKGKALTRRGQQAPPPALAHAERLVRDAAKFAVVVKELNLLVERVDDAKAWGTRAEDAVERWREPGATQAFEALLVDHERFGLELPAAADVRACLACLEWERDAKEIKRRANAGGANDEEKGGSPQKGSGGVRVRPREKARRGRRRRRWTLGRRYQRWRTSASARRTSTWTGSRRASRRRSRRAWSSWTTGTRAWTPRSAGCPPTRRARNRPRRRRAPPLGRRAAPGSRACP